MFITNVLIAQMAIAQIDSIINEHERRWRTELNKSDTLYIEKLFTKVKNNECNVIQREFAEGWISPIMLQEITKRILNEGLCFDAVFNNICLLKSLPEQDIMGGEIYPVKHLLMTDSEYRTLFIHRLLDASLIDNCKLILEIDRKLVYSVGEILSKDEKLIDDYLKETTLLINECKYANITILKNFTNEK
jgi:hypothetical protein